jgi:glycosyltransferase involved in cell wall biosynthesis
LALNVLIVDRAPPLDLMQGATLIAFHLFRRLRHHRLTLVCPAPLEGIEETRVLLEAMFDEVHLVPRARTITALAGAVEPDLVRRGLPTPGRRNEPDASRRLLQTIDSLVQTGSWDLIHVRQLPMAGYLPTAPIGRLVELIDAETLAASRATGTRAKVRGLVARTLERRAAATADIVTVVSPVDAEAIRRVAPGTRVEVVVNGVDTDQFAPGVVGDLEIEPDTIVFSGAMSFAPNVEAVSWFCHEVMPLLLARRPGVRFRIVGRDPSPAVMALAEDPAVVVTGFVDDVRPWLVGSTAVVAPMVSGSGVKNKLLEAMSMGRPIVTTSIGVESLDVEPGRDLLVADEPAATAEALDRLLGDPDLQARLGSAARERVVARYSWDACAARYDELYADLAAITAQRRSA